jgi:hypothetical protein
MDKKLLALYITIVLLDVFLVAGFIVSFGEMSSLRAQITDLEEDVAKMRATNYMLSTTVENLNLTVKHLVEVVQNRSMSQGVSEGLVLQINVADSIKTGETVRVNFSLTNFGSKKVTLVFPSPKIFDFKVLDSSGKVVYQWSQDKSFPAVIVEVVLEPGQAKTASLPWECRLPPGEYLLVGVVSSYNITITSNKVVMVKS